MEMPTQKEEALERTAGSTSNAEDHEGLQGAAVLPLSPGPRDEANVLLSDLQGRNKVGLEIFG
eukprot:10181326-Karenia_brevis.AAC.1